jgi:hypothetical protein
MKKKTKTSWEVIKHSVDTRISEVRGEDGLNYEQAKQEAIAYLESETKRYLDRLAELQADVLYDRGRFPELKVWEGPKKLVAAKTKKRAMELLRYNRYDFNSSYVAVDDGDWWYSFAREERVWARRRDERGLHTGEYVKLITEEEHDSLLIAAFAPYKKLPFSDLEPLVGQEVLSQGCTPAGAPYSMRVAIEWYAESCIKINIQVEDDWGVVRPGPRCIFRLRDEEAAVASPEATQEVAHA